MPVALQPALALWLKSQLNIILQHPLPSGEYQLSYNDQIYLDNGYLIGILLRRLLHQVDLGTSLLKIRKIAHISSNQNWRILAEILKELGFEEQIDPHQINLSLVRNVLQFLWDKFGNKKEATRKLKNTFLDIYTFQGSRPLESSQNLLEFLVLGIQKAFCIEVGECLGLLVDQGRSLRQLIIFGTSEGYYQILRLYQIILAQIPALNRLLSEQYGGQDHFLSLIGAGVLSQSAQVCHLCCTLIESIDSDWPICKGIDTLLRSPHFTALDLLLHRIEHMLEEVFNEELYKRFGGHTNNQLRIYNQLIRYFNQSLFGRETFKCLEINYYISRALQVFQPEQKINYGSKERTTARQLLSSITRYFEKKLIPRDHNQVLYCFQFSLTDHQQERIASLSILFQLLSDIFQKQRDFGFKLFKTLWKYYTSGTNDIRNFIIDNLLWMFRSNPSAFPVAQFLHLQEPTDTLQPSTLALLLQISSIRDLNHQLGEVLLKSATIYYFQQLCASGALQIISNIIKNQRQTVWAGQISQEILDKWPNLQIPPYQPVPTHSKKIKFRSVGLKKKEMIQFTELNRYKNLLLALVQISDKAFLNTYARLIVSTITKVSKSKSRQMQSTKGWLSKLLDLIESRIAQFKKTPLPFSQVSFMLQQSSNGDTSQISKLAIPQQTVSRIGQIIQQQNNQFMTQMPVSNPLLPFSQQEIQIFPLVSEEMYFQHYQQNFITILNERYSRLLQFLTDKYKTALDLQQFLTSIGVMTYISSHLRRLQDFQKTLSISQDQLSKKVSKLILQTAMLAFEFKLNRRVSIKCLESFYDLLVQKNLHQPFQEQNTQFAKIQRKMQFDPHITTSLKKINSKMTVNIECFQILSQILQMNLGVSLIEPVSTIVTKIKQKSDPKLSKAHQEQSLPTDELRQLEQLQKMIENESSIGQNSSHMKNHKLKSISLKNNQKKIIAIDPPKQIEVSQKWAQVQKKVIMRRRELQAKAIQNIK